MRGRKALEEQEPTEIAQVRLLGWQEIGVSGTDTESQGHCVEMNKAIPSTPINLPTVFAIVQRMSKAP